MTSRVRRIVLAMYGHTRPAPRMAFVPAAEIRALFARVRCYEAMDDLDPYQDVNPSESIVFVHGNFGLPCA